MYPFQTVRSLPELAGLSRVEKKRALRACRFVPFKSWKVWLGLLLFFFVPFLTKTTTLYLLKVMNSHPHFGMIVVSGLLHLLTLAHIPSSYVGLMGSILLVGIVWLAYTVIAVVIVTQTAIAPIRQALQRHLSEGLPADH
ncbi:MAG TPA: hypothetical protein VN203_09305 [Candidatus Acidoferrum sp.]|nr:hypothetical protein [Candidatus Acidoferrum sp.]